MKNSRCWFNLMSLADTNDWGHGDTLHGQMKQRETKALVDKISKLKIKAMNPSSLGVLARWSGEIRRKILLLPPVSRIPDLSMFEINKIAKNVSEIEQIIDRYRASRLMEILDGANRS